MSNLPHNLPEMMRAIGLKVVEIDGWEHRGRPGAFGPEGPLVHHTGSSDRDPHSQKDDLAYAKWLFLEGRDDLNAPLCQLSLGRDGTVYLGAAGRANHGGKARATGPMPAGDANEMYVGIECHNSGSEGWTAAQYNALVKLCALLCRKVTSSPASSVRGHRETSVTGKWDPGLMDMDKLRKDVSDAMRASSNLKPKPTGKRLTFQHTSLQYSDTPEQMRADVEKMFSTGRKVITWTEASVKTPLPKLIREIGAKHDYDVYAHNQGTGVAVRKRFGKIVKKGYVPVIDGVAKQYSDRGIAWVQIQAGKELISYGAVHYVTRGRRKRHGFRWTQNVRFARAIGKWAKAQGQGSKLAFVAGDFNIVDRIQDVFFDEPLTTCWDELQNWPDTGHGNIDAIASLDADKRVKCIGARALDDREMPLNTDHFTIFATYELK